MMKKAPTLKQIYARKRRKLAGILARMTANERRRWRPKFEDRILFMQPRERKQAIRRQARKVAMKRRVMPSLIVASHDAVRKNLSPKYLHSHARAMQGLKVALSARDGRA